MASITSLTGSSSSSSIYGSRNIISGLASGMDTESMIENAVSGLKERIAGLNQDREMLEWEQSAYRSIIDKLSSFSDKYLSYTSSTNLLSAAFFNNSTTVTTSGTYSNLISATGNPTSTVKILAVRQLAEAATHTASIGSSGSFTSKALDLSEPISTSNVTGSMTLSLDGTEYEISFDESDVYTSVDELVTGINTKLEEAGLKDKVSAEVDGNGFKFTTTSGDLKISAAEGDLVNTLGISASAETVVTGTTFELKGDLSTSETTLDAMIGENFSFTLDGVTKTITLDDNDKANISSVADLANVLQGKIDTAFGSGKVNVSEADGQLTFATTSTGSTLSITGAEELGLSASASSSVNTSQTLSELKVLDNLTQNAEGKYDFTINGKTLSFGADATLNDVISAVNNDEDIGVKISYSQMTNKFQLTSKETGTAGKIQIQEGDLAAALFGATDKTGTDAIVDMNVNGEDLTGVTRSSNSFTVDGMTIKLKGTFTATEEEAVTFSAAADADKIVNTLKSMIEDYNTMANEIKDAYATQPLRDSSGDRYEPLTAEDAEDMSESAIEKYEKKAKTGILFGDSDLSNLYNELRSAISSLDLEAIGISTEYESGKTTLKLDETKLRSVLENDPNKVRNTLTKSTVSGATEDGALTRIQNTIEKYAKTTGTKGILVKLAGSEKSAVSLIENEYKDKMDRLDEQIERWQEKLSNKIDYYTRQFSALEQMISKMNSQSSALSGMMGY